MYNVYVDNAMYIVHWTGDIRHPLLRVLCGYYKLQIHTITTY